MAAPYTGPGAKKRPEDRLGNRTKAEQEAGKADVIDPDVAALVQIEVPEGLQPDENWHRVARQAWDSYVQSPLRVYYETTDLVHAWVTCQLISSVLSRGMSAGQVQQLRMYMNDLGFTESARRAMDVAIKREPVTKPDPGKVVAINHLRLMADGVD